MICIVCGRIVSTRSRYCEECGAFQPEAGDRQVKASTKKTKWWHKKWRHPQ